MKNRFQLERATSPGGFARDSRGMAAVEFALVGPVFLAMILSLFELGILMMKISMVDFAVAEATKFIYTGAVQSGTPTREEIADFVCSKATILTDCGNNVTVELTPIANFSSPPATDVPCIDSADDDAIAPAVAYSTGNGSQVMLMRVCITTGIMTPGLGAGLSLVSTDTNRMQIVGVAAFMNEPF